MLVRARSNQAHDVRGDSEQECHAHIVDHQMIQRGKTGMVVRTNSQLLTSIGWNFRPIVFGLVLSGVLEIVGCTQEALEPVQSVAWYKAHEAERVAMASKCHNNPGQLQKTPNCINAQQAVDDIAMGR